MRTRPSTFINLNALLINLEVTKMKVKEIRIKVYFI